MKTFYLIGGLFFLFVAIAPLKRNMEEYDVQRRGELVKVVLTSVPRESIFRKIFIEFEFNGKHYSKKVGRKFSQEHKVGDTLVFRHKKGSDIFLFQGEPIEMEFAASGLLCLCGVFMVIKGIRQQAS